MGDSAVLYTESRHGQPDIYRIRYAPARRSPSDRQREDPCLVWLRVNVKMQSTWELCPRMQHRLQQPISKDVGWTDCIPVICMQNGFWEPVKPFLSRGRSHYTLTSSRLVSPELPGLCQTQCFTP